MATWFNLLSSSRNVRGIKFRVSSLPFREVNARPHFDVELLRRAGFEPHWRTVTMISGGRSNYEDKWVKNATKELLGLLEGQVNVIQVS